MTRDPTWGTGCYRGVALIKRAASGLNDLLTIPETCRIPP